MHPTADRQRDGSAAGQRSEVPLWALFTLFFFSGFAALVYQVMWMRSFGLVFGSTTRAAALVLAAFFLGMALGNWLGGRFARGRRGALLAYALAEIGIALGALLVIPWLELYRGYYPSLYQAGFGAQSLTLLEVLLGFVAMAPPCAAMGATLPLMSRAIVSREDHLSTRVGAAYALNTAGATAGALMSGFFLPLWLGTRNTILLAALISAGSGLVALSLWYAAPRLEPGPKGLSEPNERATQPEKTQAGASVSSDSGLLILFAVISGFGTLALEVFYTRLLLNFSDSSVYTFALVLAVFLVSLALGSVLVSLLADRLRSPWTLIAWCSAAGALAVMASPSVFQWMWTSMPPPGRASQWGYLLWMGRAAAIIIAPGVILLGTILPAIWNTTRDVEGTGARIGRLTGANTLAATAGSLAAGFLIIPSLGVARGIVLVAACYGVLAVLAISRLELRQRFLCMGALVVCLLAVWTLQPARLRPVRLGSKEKLIHFYEGESGSVAVTKTPKALFMRMNNQYGLGSSGKGKNVRVSLGRLGLALHPAPRDVAFLGVATGLTLSAVRDFPKLKSVLAMEIIPGVLEAAKAFESVNRRVLHDPRVSIVMADGRNHLFGTSETFDVVTADLFVPWHAGAAYLYTAEYFDSVRRRLNPAGLFVVWVQASQVTTTELRIIAGTFVDVFQHAELWLNDLDPSWQVVALIGRRSGEVTPPSAHNDLAALPPRASCAPRIVSVPSLSDPLFTRVKCMAGGDTLRRWAEGVPRNTDDHPIIEFQSGQGHFDLRGSGELQRLLTEVKNLASVIP